MSMDKGNVCLNNKDWKGAISAFRKVIKKNPKDIWAWNNLGRALYNYKKYAEAIDAYRKVLELSPKDVSAWISLGRALNNSKQHIDAIDACRKALEINPNDALAWNDLGFSLEAAHRFDEALIAFQKAKELNPLLEYQQSVERLNRAVNGKTIQDEEQLEVEHAALERTAIEKLKKLVQVSKKMNISRMTQILGINEAELNNRIVDWAAEYGFTIDGDFVEFGMGRKDDFIASLKDAFDDWARKTETKEGKLE